jgi:hypothetical protein
MYNDFTEQQGGGIISDEDKYALKEFLRGFGVFLGASAVFILILLVLSYFASGGEPLKPSFEVVDTYKGCDVVRYAPHQVAEYKYFLYCENNK